MRIGLMGGTFNPVHLAHLRAAEEARELCNLDRVFFIPALEPPHKMLAGATPFELRCEMVKRAIADNPFFELSLIEGQREGKSYSIDTITVFRDEYPKAWLYFIIGSDSFLEISSWRRYTEIVRLCSLIVVERSGRRIINPPSLLSPDLASEFRYNSTTRTLEHCAGTSVRFLPACPLDISSTEIRRLAASGHSITYLVPHTVEEYIKQQRIYS